MTPTPSSLARRLRFHQLELLTEVAESGSLGEAALRLHVSRAAVSKSLKELEAVLGLTLFERSSRGMTPTASGLRVARHARLMLNELGNLAQDVGTVTQPLVSRLRIGMPPYVATYAAPAMFLRLRKMSGNEHVQLQVHEGRLGALIEHLLLGELDAVMALYAPRAVDAMDLSMLAIRHCRTVSMVVVASPALGLARRKHHKWADLQHLPWILPPGETHLRTSVDGMFTTHGTRAPIIAIESSSLAANVQMSAAGLGLAVVPLQAAQADIDAGRLLVLTMQQPLPETTIVLMYRKVSAIYIEAISALDKAAGA